MNEDLDFLLFILICVVGFEGDRIVNNIKDMNKGIKRMNDEISSINKEIRDTSFKFFDDMNYDIFSYNELFGVLKTGWTRGSGFGKLMSDMNLTRSNQLDY